jgi:hypothetical protein
MLGYKAHLFLTLIIGSHKCGCLVESKSVASTVVSLILPPLHCTDRSPLFTHRNSRFIFLADDIVALSVRCFEMIPRLRVFLGLSEVCDCWKGHIHG